MTAVCIIGIVAGIIVFIVGGDMALADVGQNWNTGSGNGKGCAVMLVGAVIVIASIIGLVV